MRIRVRLWLWMLDRILRHQSPRVGFWILNVLDVWDRHLNLWAPTDTKGAP
jgi:hypothetical protein